VQNHVQTVGAVEREDDLLFRRRSENLRRSMPTPVNRLLQLLSGIGGSATDRSTILAVVFVDGVVDALGLGKACCGVVEINRLLNRVADKTGL
jgi:hypothetical protein